MCELARYYRFTSNVIANLAVCNVGDRGLIGDDGFHGDRSLDASGNQVRNGASGGWGLSGKDCFEHRIISNIQKIVGLSELYW